MDLPLSSETGSRAIPPGRAAAAAAAGQHRLSLALFVVAGAAAGLVLSLVLAPPPALEAELLRLLRGMVLIKGLIASAAAALLWWRLGRPIGRGLAARYGLALGLCAGALGWLWGLHLLLLGSLAFYAGLAGLALTARRDPLLSTWPPRGRARAA